MINGLIQDLSSSLVLSLGVELFRQVQSFESFACTPQCINQGLHYCFRRVSFDLWGCVSMRVGKVENRSLEA